MLTTAVARTIWRYEPETGVFFWLISPKYDVAIGARAGSSDGKYWRLQYKGKLYKASRVAWLMTAGEWPKNQIDHINGEKLDDRLINLREATNAENCRNRKGKRTNQTGVKGVSKTRYGYQVAVAKNGKNYYLGHFKELSTAKRKYDYAASRLHGEFAKTG